MRKIIKWVLIILPSAIVVFFLLKIYKLRRNKMSRIRLYRKLNRYLKYVCRVLGLELHVDGIENIPLEDSFLITPNHQSLIDPLLFFCVFDDPVSFACKDSIKKIPVVNDFVNLIDGCYLERDNLRQEIKTMKYIRDIMSKKHVNYIIFPEGTRTKDSNLKMNEFKSGAFKYPMSIEKKILPVCINGTNRVFNKKIKDKKYPITVSFLPPISKQDYQNLSTNDVSELVHNRIENRLNQVLTKGV